MNAGPQTTPSVKPSPVKACLEYDLTDPEGQHEFQHEFQHAIAAKKYLAVLWDVQGLLRNHIKYPLGGVTTAAQAFELVRCLRDRDVTLE